jgi:hypothetical protein
MANNNKSIILDNYACNFFLYLAQAVQTQGDNPNFHADGVAGCFPVFRIICGFFLITGSNKPKKYAVHSLNAAPFREDYLPYNTDRD